MTPKRKTNLGREISDVISSLPRTHKLSTRNWPSDPVIKYISSQMDQQLKDFVTVHRGELDPLDLKYQVLFRLTTFDIERIFVQGELLRGYVKSRARALAHRISNIDSRALALVNLDDDLIKDVMVEQYEVIKSRLGRSNLNLEKILDEDNIFSMNNWKIIKTDGKIYAKDNISDNFIPLEVREVDIDYSRKLFEDLHYIHTPRGEVALGLFIDGEETPFSTIAATRIDRDYKAVALIAQGYDPSFCWDIARLYTGPHPPANTTSVMLTEIIKHLKRVNKHLQACVTAITPSFSSGLSMVGGSFEDSLLAVPLEIKFGKSGESGYMERLTERRLARYNGNLEVNKWPLLPVIELLRRVRPPEFEPLIGSAEMITLDERFNRDIFAALLRN